MKKLLSRYLVFLLMFSQFDFLVINAVTDYDNCEDDLADCILGCSKDSTCISHCHNEYNCTQGSGAGAGSGAGSGTGGGTGSGSQGSGSQTGSSSGILSEVGGGGGVAGIGVGGVVTLVGIVFTIFRGVSSYLRARNTSKFYESQLERTDLTASERSALSSALRKSKADEQRTLGDLVDNCLSAVQPHVQAAAGARPTVKQFFSLRAQKALVLNKDPKEIMQDLYDQLGAMRGGTGIRNKLFKFIMGKKLPTVDARKAFSSDEFIKQLAKKITNTSLDIILDKSGISAENRNLLGTLLEAASKTDSVQGFIDDVSSVLSDVSEDRVEDFSSILSPRSLPSTSSIVSRQPKLSELLSERGVPKLQLPPRQAEYVQELPSDQPVLERSQFAASREISAQQLLEKQQAADILMDIQREVQKQQLAELPAGPAEVPAGAQIQYASDVPSGAAAAKEEEAGEAIAQRELGILETEG